MLDLSTVSTVSTTSTKEVLPMTTRTLTTDDSKISAIVAVLYKAGMSQIDSLVTAAALLDTQEYLGRPRAKWWKKMDKAMRGTVLEVDMSSLDYDELTHDWEGVLERTELITIDYVSEQYDGELYGDSQESMVYEGEFLKSLEFGNEPHYPTPATEAIVRRKQTRTKTSKCFEDAIHNLEDTMFVVDEFMMKVAEKVRDQVPHGLTNAKGKEVFERYVFDGCRHLIEIGNTPVISEFFGDTRGRIYQAACHGPNGQSSDFARSMMDLHGVHSEYDCEKALKVISAEIDDMHSFDDLSVVLSQVTSASSFIANELLLGQASLCKKPWSLMKAVNIKRGIKRHMKAPEQFAKPYIGMAFGLDAKCSGPQLGALMTNDQHIAAACGFSETVVDDAYKIASNSCKSAGFPGIPRAVIKKPYMGIFYGQSYQAFFDVLEKELEVDTFRHLIKIIENGPKKTAEKNAKAFHAAIEASFGKMQNLRDAIKNAHSYMDGKVRVFYTKQATSHLMPDGFKVSMNYKVKTNLFNEMVTFDTELPDVTIHGAAGSHTFKKITFTTQKDALSDYMRTGFVNLIQATDALLARLIINELAQSQGAQHIIAVHDCFRVNINDMIDGKLHRAIQSAYMTLFGDQTNMKKGYMTQGTDIMKLYFEGVENARLTPIAKKMSQFDVDGDRCLDEILKSEFADLVADMENTLDETGSTYFFAK